MPRPWFDGFAKSDFAAFEDRKVKNPAFNEERKIVYQKMKALQAYIDSMLKNGGFALSGKVSQYWINGRKLSVGGIWLAYTDIKPYYTVCQLNCGIHENYFFVGIQINSRAKNNLDNALNYISSNEEEFRSYFEQLNENHAEVGYGSYELKLCDSSVAELRKLEKIMRMERSWFSMGEWYSKNEYLSSSANITQRIPQVFETLFPVYLVFAGRRPLGRKSIDKLLRIGDVKEKDVTRIERALVSEASQITEKEREEIIAEIDKRNQGEKAKKAAQPSGTPYRRNPVLSLMLKQKYKDHCQICNLRLKIEKGFFCDTHHLIPLKSGGSDSSDNIVVVCPNHHRLLDRSCMKIASRNVSRIVAKTKSQTLVIRL